jgi:glycine C-acetyltransferase/8-amino-7-oxononanoate synthase
MSRYLMNAARTFIFSCALAPPAVAGALAALGLLEEKPQRIRRLAANAGTLRAGLSREGFAVASRTHIVPLIVGDADLAVRMCEAALARGIFVQAIRPPAVPAMTARLRLAVMATHREEELLEAAHTLGAAARSLGIAPQQAIEPEPALAPVADVDEGRPDPSAGSAGSAAPAAPAAPRGVFDFEAPERARRAA